MVKENQVIHIAQAMAFVLASIAISASISLTVSNNVTTSSLDISNLRPGYRSLAQTSGSWA